jgi:hypothetical protein
MGLASGLATIFGFLLMFWNKVAVTVGKIFNRITGRPGAPAEKPADPAAPSASE